MDFQSCRHNSCLFDTFWSEKSGFRLKLIWNIEETTSRVDDHFFRLYFGGMQHFSWYHLYHQSSLCRGGSHSSASLWVNRYDSQLEVWTRSGIEIVLNSNYAIIFFSSKQYASPLPYNKIRIRQSPNTWIIANFAHQSDWLFDERFIIIEVINTSSK